MNFSGKRDYAFRKGDLITPVHSMTNNETAKIMREIAFFLDMERVPFKPRASGLPRPGAAGRNKTIRYLEHARASHSTQLAAGSFNTLPLDALLESLKDRKQPK